MQDSVDKYGIANRADLYGGMETLAQSLETSMKKVLSPIRQALTGVKVSKVLCEACNGTVLSFLKSGLVHYECILLGKCVSVGLV